MRIIDFPQFLQTAFQHGAYTTDDVIAAVLPLFKTVQAVHDAGLVAAFDQEDILQVHDRTVTIDPALAHPPLDALDKVDALTAGQNPHFRVVDKIKVSADNNEAVSLLVHKDLQKTLQHAAYIPGYRSYEMLLGHHDEQTDIFCLGLVLASVALGIDLHDPQGLDAFVEQRLHPLRFARIHPAVGTLITEMTMLHRAQRTQDLQEAIHRLEHYRDFDPEKQLDLGQVAGWVYQERKERQAFILNKLRNRLFDVSRRNRLLYYKPNARFANLTLGSVPMVLHHQSIRPELLFTWNDEIAQKVIGMKDLALNKYLRFEDHIYLPAVLNKVRLEAQRDVQEYGFSQLKLVIAFLKWHNLRDPEEAEESIFSPLLLIPAELKKKKQAGGDQYVLSITDNNAEVNPVLANQLRELYGIELPDMVDLEEMSLEQFYQLLQVQIEGANRGIVLQYMNKPGIRLIYKEARETVNQYHQKLQKAPIPAPAEDHELFQLAAEADNPYRWDFDICHVVLGNFNYKKMSLVRDYNAVIDQPQQHAVFEQLFSAQPKPVEEATPAPALPEEWYHVIQADPTQAKAILQARKGESYIIQGPPGTGKSQTITNLIADFVARGKQVLFVCEKRAALDVVFHRLRQQGLDELCCYIHDSQADKRAFIKDLKLTYESFLRQGPDLHSTTLKRNALLHTLQQQLQLLQEFHDTHAHEQEHAGVAVRTLIERLLALRPLLRPLDPVQEETVPHYKQWIAYGNMVELLGEALEESGAEPVFAAHPLSKVHEQVFTAEHPQTMLNKLVTDSKALLDTVEEVIRKHVPEVQTLDVLKQLVTQATLLLPLAENDNLQLVDPQQPAARAFELEVKQHRMLQKAFDDAAKENIHWKHKFSEQDTLQAIDVALKQENSFWRFLSGSWRRLKKQMSGRYDLAQHAVTPSYSSILGLLKAEYDAARLLAEKRQSIMREYGTDNIDLTWLSIERLRTRLTDPSLQYLLQHPDARQTVIQLAPLQDTLYRVDQQLQQTLQDPPTQHILTLQDELESIRLNAPALEELLPALGNYVGMPDALRLALRSLPWTPGELEAGMAHHTLKHIYQFNKPFAGINSQVIEQAVEKIRHCYNELLGLNAALIRADIRQRFMQHVQLSNRAASQVSEEEQELARSYADGRKILENEFAKSMRYKSIRELTSRSSGLVLKDLKPVWLMSPLSVSDSLPLDQPFFDAVIFDEASQITLEEGVPALYRAPQTIIVGDDRQMPPTDFFSAKAGDPDDLERDEEDDELLSADADSLLTQGARKMNSVMLGWHYRSHSETLISYSNHAFYGAGLLTIPDRSIHSSEKPPISITAPSDAMFTCNALFDRSISFHHLPEGTYAKRGNIAEATYIAHLVRELLLKKTPESIGIVAFSQEQQNAIEAALEALAANDKKFEALLDDAAERTDEGQFTGLFVKNLENVQGDERDIIIMSVCYAPDPRGKMSMHFGPINKKGGEKRLNVIFSRAKKHMAVVSSIRHHQITNVYNAGAGYLRRFLHYAETVSTGHMEQARSILEGLASDKRSVYHRTTDTVILQDIRAQLEQQGFTVSEHVGQSGFRCSLAVKAAPDDKFYALSILVDDDDYYRHENVLEQYYQRPAILESFGWKTMTVYAKDWLHQPQRVMEDILRRLGRAPGAAPLASMIATPAGTTRLTMGDKFWEVAISGAKLFIRQGKSGTKGAIQVKSCVDEADAEKERERLVQEKKAGGWKGMENEEDEGQLELPL
ncbi:AAA domain-containing protein [Chitinophaga cymbidii]|uniref:DNA helicase n=1 Tax=Chitinophaga cymbidii TaxID=1096750 RepID=A0A512RSC3_9BACT|nr:AAA domain-containing protein [Chitinophaga cymbidii]GEP98600.1 DNA helicase [Chitinophaga cymbidii]